MIPLLTTIPASINTPIRDTMDTLIPITSMKRIEPIPAKGTQSIMSSAFAMDSNCTAITKNTMNTAMNMAFAMAVNSSFIILLMASSR